jgi:hypothetical protein
VAEELGLEVPIGDLLCVDWAPHPDEGDKVLFVFDRGLPAPADLDAIRFRDGELAEFRFVDDAALDHLTIARLARRIRASLDAQRPKRPVYLEHGLTPAN